MHSRGCVIWLTGLSGSGKSTLARGLYHFYKDRGLRVEHLDGDEVRSLFTRTGFSRRDRDEHIHRMGFVASLLERQGVIVIASFISPYRKARRQVREMCQQFIEVYVDCSLTECERRDPKGLYKKARLGYIRDFTGISDPYEVPEGPHLIIPTESVSIADSTAMLIAGIEKLDLRTQDQNSHIP
jgi:adenylylsulfate kinase